MRSVSLLVLLLAILGLTTGVVATELIPSTFIVPRIASVRYSNAKIQQLQSDATNLISAFLSAPVFDMTFHFESNQPLLTFVVEASDSSQATSLRQTLKQMSGTGVETLTTALEEKIHDAFNITSDVATPVVWNQCSYDGPSGFPSSVPSRGPTQSINCGGNVAFDISGSRILQESDKAAICTAMSYPNCESVTMETQIPVEGYATVRLTFPTENSLTTIASLIQAVRTASTLKAVGIVQVAIASTALYSTAEIVVLQGTTCGDRLKWLIFLLLLIPLTAVLMRWVYKRGQIRGREVARKNDSDVTAQANRLAQMANAGQQLGGLGGTGMKYQQHSAQPNPKMGYEQQGIQGDENQQYQYQQQYYQPQQQGYNQQQRFARTASGSSAAVHNQQY